MFGSCERESGGDPPSCLHVLVLFTSAVRYFRGGGCHVLHRGQAPSPPSTQGPVPVVPRLSATHSLFCIQVVGIILAIVSGLLIGSSFVFKKKGLIRSQNGGELGEGVAYLKSVRPFLLEPPATS